MNEITTKSFLPSTITNELEIGTAYVGIDFGTSTSVVSIAQYNPKSNAIETRSIRIPQILADGHTINKSDIIPTVIAYLEEAGKILIGNGAFDLKNKKKLGRDIWYSFKLGLGEDIGAKYTDSLLRDKPPFNIKTAKDATKVFFAYLKRMISNELGDRQIKYSISIPASFEANQRKDLLDALAANDMMVSSQALIDEPNAAFISYAVERATMGSPIIISPDYDSKVLVFDFGGGTCDISILEIGQDLSGFRAKNIAISKYTELGGDDIDRYITYHYLMPRFLEENGKKPSDFRTKEKKRIATALLKVSERLKIIINEELAAHTINGTIPASKDNEDERASINADIAVSTTKGTLSGNEFWLSYRELTDTMSVFTSSTGRMITSHKGEQDYASIFLPIKSAIKKSGVDKDEIDYVLLIGGSSKSPYIQEAIHQYFDDSEMLLPGDLRTHVSRGAAIHSLLYNGFGRNLIRPITSEPIIIITKDSSPKVIVPANTEIPCNTISIDDLVSDRDGQSTIELPICVGNANKMLFNLKIESKDPMGFKKNTPVHLSARINADKMLHISATCEGDICAVEPVSPFANKELSSEDRIALKAERKANNEMYNRGGTPSLKTLEELREAYKRAGKLLKAAETYELQGELYPSSVNWNNLGVLYDNAGMYDKAIDTYKDTLEKHPNDGTILFNMALSLRKSGNREEYKKYMKEAITRQPNDPCILYEYSKIDRSEGAAEEAEQKLNKALEILMDTWSRNELKEWEYSWFKSVAQQLGKPDIVKKLEQEEKSNLQGYLYNEENLSITSDSLPSIR